MARIGFSGRQVLVTGGSAGIGRALVEQLIDLGAERVVVVARDISKLASLANSHPKKLVPIAFDLSQTARFDDLVQLVIHAAPQLSAVFNNAGTQLLTDFLAPETVQNIGALETEVALNFFASIVLCAHLIPHFSHQNNAVIVNITSGLALAPKQSSPVYCGAKAGLRSFTRALRYQCEIRAPNIRVIEALPPIVDTAMTSGRGRGKISPDACAKEILNGVQAGMHEIYVGKSKILRVLMCLAPAFGYRIMRNG